MPSLIADENKVALEKVLFLAPETVQLGHTNETITKKALMSIPHNYTVEGNKCSSSRKLLLFYLFIVLFYLFIVSFVVFALLFS